MCFVLPLASMPYTGISETLSHCTWVHTEPPPLHSACSPLQTRKTHPGTPVPQAFTRVTQQDPDHGEAWNNIAAIWVQLDRNKEAFSALGECIKHKRESWQVREGGERGVEIGSHAGRVRNLGAPTLPLPLWDSSCVIARFVS